MKINHPDWYPAYVNPSFDELAELARSGWDTCRILVPYGDDPCEDMVIASGYGNTHDSVQSRYFIHLGATEISIHMGNGLQRRRWKTNGARLPQMQSFILHHRNGIAYMNQEDTGGGQCDRADRWHLSDKHMEILKDLIRESNLSL